MEQIELNVNTFIPVLFCIFLVLAVILLISIAIARMVTPSAKEIWEMYKCPKCGKGLMMKKSLRFNKGTSFEENAGSYYVCSRCYHEEG